MPQVNKMASYLISSVRIFDGEFVLHPDGLVLIENDRIKLISLTVHPDVQVGCIKISGSGYTLLPGLIDAHVHVYDEVNMLAEALQYGVTTVLDLHNETDYADNIKKAAAEKKNYISDVLSSYNSAIIPGGWLEAITRFLHSGEEVGNCLPKYIINDSSKNIHRRMTSSLAQNH